MTGQIPYFEIRVFKHFAHRHRKMEIEKCFRSNENENKQRELVKKLHGEEVLQVENRSFTPVVFAANDGMRKESIYRRLAEMIVDKCKVPTSIVTKNIRTLVLFSLLKSTIRFLRASTSTRVP